MPRIVLTTRIRAPIARCFDLMRDVDTHIRSAGPTRERAVAGVTAGLLTAGDRMTWEATHFGVRQRLTVLVTRCEPPYRFEDVMLSGAFRSFTHRHALLEDGAATVMVDVFDFRAPFGPLGRLAEFLFLTRYMRGFLRRRALALKRIAERG